MCIYIVAEPGEPEQSILIRNGVSRVVQPNTHLSSSLVRTKEELRWVLIG